MTCPRCGAYAWLEMDPELGADVVCIVGHRVPQAPVLDIPKPVAGGRRTKYGDKERV